MAVREQARKTIQVVGARQNNLRNINVEIPRDQLTVVTGVSGSGKSTLAFEVIYAEAQRRFLDSLSTFARRRIEQVRKADVDFVYGLSPVIAIGQKTGVSNPRSTVGTMTDIYDYLRLLYATCGNPSCPYCGKQFPMRSVNAIAAHLLTLPQGTSVSLFAPLWKIYDEPWQVLVDEVRKQGARTLLVDGEEMDAADETEWDEQRGYRMEALIERIALRGDVHKVLVRAIESCVKRFGNGYLRIALGDDVFANQQDRDDFFSYFGCPEHGVLMPELHPFYFSFNDADSACRTCGGIGQHRVADARLVVERPDKSLRDGALSTAAYNPTKNWSYKDVMFYSLSEHYGFSLDAPWKELPEAARQAVLYGSGGEKIAMRQPEGAKRNWMAGRTFAYDGVLADINRWYRRWREQPVSDSFEQTMFHRVMVESVCPDCKGFRLKPQRRNVTLGGLSITEVSRLVLPELVEFLKGLSFPADRTAEGEQITRELLSRIGLLLDIGLYYIHLDRRADSISGGESQRIRLSTQISSGLMGMLYVLDEPSIGLHARDGQRIIDTLRRLRDIGNSVIVVEHDLEMMRAADYIVEVGPGAGAGGGQIVATGTPEELTGREDSLTGAYLSGRLCIPLPGRRRPPAGKAITIRGARHNNLKNVDVSIPLGQFVCVTGVSGSGKSSLIHDILVKKLTNLMRDPRVIPGDHDSLEGAEHLSNVVNIDQSPIGRNARSNPATYVGFYDRICQIFAGLPDSVARGYKKQDFSFNSKHGMRCEECSGNGVIVRELQFMADIETVCPICGGVRYQKEILEIKHNGKSIADVLETPIEEAVEYFREHPYIRHKLDTMNKLGLGYLKLGQSSTTLSGGEAQRVKLATELGKIKRGAHNLYILDEPTTGLHLSDIQKLLASLNALVDAGHTVLIIEHQLDVIKVADYVIDIGPEGGRNGGTIVAQGTPEQVSRVEASHTGRYLREILA